MKTTYTEAIQYLRNLPDGQKLVYSWMDIRATFQDLPKGVRQALIDALIIEHNVANNRHTETLESYKVTT